MLFTLSGMTMLDRELQFKNAPSPILFTLLGMTMLDRELQSENAPSPILFTLSGMTMLDRELQLAYLLLVDYQCYTL